MSIQGHYLAYLAVLFFFSLGLGDSLPEHGGTTQVHLENGQHQEALCSLWANHVHLLCPCLPTVWTSANWRSALHICERLGLGQKRVAGVQMGSGSCTWLRHHQDV